MPAAHIADVVRGNTVESVHYGHVSVVDGDGNVVFELGDPRTVTYFRSAAKAFQFIPCITSGAADAFGFNEEEFALAVASHSGEPEQVAVAARMLAKAGFTESDLRCGTHRPTTQEAADQLVAAGRRPTQLHNNCSGKHAAMLAFARHIGAEPGNYDSLDNRIQKRILRCVADFTEVPEDKIGIGIDGCAAPNFAIPVTSMARAFANLVNPVRFPDITRSACRRIVDAMMKYPELIDGKGNLDTVLMETVPGRIVSKIGADGVWLCGVLPSERHQSGLGIALKVADGDDHRARPVVAVDLLRQLGILTRDQVTELSPRPLRNRRGDVVGTVTSTVRLDHAA